MEDKIIRYLVYNDGVEMDYREATEHEQKVRTTWCKPSDVEKLESSMQSAQEEIHELKLHVDNAENQPRASKMVATLSEELERLKCCGNCNHYNGNCRNVKMSHREDIYFPEDGSGEVYDIISPHESPCGRKYWEAKG